MTYRFQATSGNIVRPIEASCLNTSTGALITPMKYGPAGTAITMWNGVVEYYTTFSRNWASYYTNTGAVTNITYAYDETSANSGVAITTGNMSAYTSCSSQYQNCDFVMVLTGCTGKTIKLVMDSLTSVQTYETMTGYCYTDCGAGPGMMVHGNLYEAYGYVGVMYSSTYGGSQTWISTTDDNNKRLYTFSAPSDTVYVTIQTFVDTVEYYTDPCCMNWPEYLTGSAQANVYALCAEG